MCQLGPISLKNAVATRLIRRGVIFCDDKFTAETHGEKKSKIAQQLANLLAGEYCETLDVDRRRIF